MKNNSIIIKEPRTIEELEAYYLLRYQILREPWNQPFGSEKDEQENISIHAMAYYNEKNILGVCRLQFNSNEEAQLRYMAVAKNNQGFGIGKKLIEYMEERTRIEGTKKIVLHARENALPFYEKCGYRIIEKSYLMWGEIQHYLMEKKL